MSTNPDRRSIAAIAVKRVAALLLVCAALAMPGMAQTSDAAYCAQLGSLALRYTGTAGGDGGLRPNPRTIWAIEQCNKGDTAAGIPILETTLRNSRFSLPSH